MLLSASTHPRSTTRTDQAGSCSANSSRQPSLFSIKNLLGCGYVGKREVVHISTGQYYRARAGFRPTDLSEDPILLSANVSRDGALITIRAISCCRAATLNQRLKQR